jgi:hypothetical protein
MDRDVLRRALDDLVFRETLWSSGGPVANFLQRAGGFAHDWYDEVQYTDWNGANVGSGPGSKVRDGVPPDPTMPWSELAPLLALGMGGRKIVALHPSTPEDVLLELASDEHFDVREALMKRRPRAPYIEAALARTGRGFIAESLASDPTLSLEGLVALLDNGERQVKCRLAQRPDLLEEALDRLVHDSDATVRCVALRHPNAKTEWLVAAAADPHDYVRAAAAENLAKRR